jgi:spore coat protein U-like protein
MTSLSDTFLFGAFLSAYRCSRRICRTIRLIVSALALIGAAPHIVMAQTCNFTAVSGSYGSFSPLSGGAIDATASFTASCTGTSNATIRLCVEMGSGSTVDGSGNRVLQDGANMMRHELYTNAARTSQWGAWGNIIITYPPNSGTSYDLTLSSGGSAVTTLTIYGRVLANQQTVIPGSYSWTSTSPGITYAYASGASCPTGATWSKPGQTWTATVTSSCFASATSIGFGSSGLLNSIIDASGTVFIQCTNTTPYKIALNYGQGTGAGGGVRKMNGPSSATVNYNLYKDAARSQLWGDSLGSNTQDSTGTGLNQNFTVYARLPVQPTPAPGNYSDLITVTVNY